MRTITILLAAIVVCSPLAAQRDAFLVPIPDQQRQVTTVWWMDDHGRIVAPVASLPYMAITDIAARPDNRAIRFLGRLGGVGGPGAVLLESNLGGTLRTLAQGRPFLLPQMILRHKDGGSIILNALGLSIGDILRWNGTTLSQQSRIGGGLAATGRAVDPQTGNILFRGQIGYVSQGYYVVDPVTGALNTLLNAASMFDTGASRIGYDVANDAFVDSTAYSSRFVDFIHIDRSTGNVTSLTRVLDATYIDMVPASGRARPVAYWALAKHRLPGYLALLGLRTNGQPIRGHRVYLPMGPPTRMFRIGSEPLSLTLQRAPNDRTLHLSFPTDAGRPYVAAFSHTGYRNGPRLPDGRAIPLTVDALTTVTVAGGVPGVIGPTLGVLDGNGQAGVRVNANPFNVSGLKLWYSVVVFDPAAPSGIAHVTGPSILVLD